MKSKLTRQEVLSNLSVKTDSKIVLAVLDGAADIRSGELRATPYEVAKIPNLDRLALEGSCGTLIPVEYGVTPGSGPAHFSLFGYDPLESNIMVGRGVLEALGLGIDLQPGDVSARGNFATVDDNKVLIDRRAGRISTDYNKKLCEKLNTGIGNINGLSFTFFPGEEHRFVLRIRGGASASIEDTDPQKIGVRPLIPKATSNDAKETAEILLKVIEKSYQILKSEQANAILLRGFSTVPVITTLKDLYKLTPLAIATHPLYLGVAKAVGMEIRKIDSFELYIPTLKKHWHKFDFFFLHFKETDIAGEDGDFDRKVASIEKFDSIVPNILQLGPDVFVVTSDHATPASYKSHGFTPVPFVIWGNKVFVDDVERFCEIEAFKGLWGQIYSKHLIGLMLAHSGKLKKFGA